jgi:SAM-dependent methyltransferase
MSYEAMNGTKGCPICGSASARFADAPRWGSWYRCSQCTLEFADPLHLEHSPEEFFDDAYRGKVQVSKMTDFNSRLANRRVILDQLHEPRLWFWTPAFDEVLNWVKQKVKPNGVMLELGCGLGFFLHALRKEGFEAVGLDVAEIAVNLNRNDGFKVWHGTIESVPDGWVVPDAIVCFFVLHHLENPLQFITTIRERWPHAPVAIVQYGPTNFDDQRSMPPRTLTRWNPRALGTLLEQGNYKAKIKTNSSLGLEKSVFPLIRNLLVPTMRVPQLYRIGKLIELNFLPRLLKPVQQQAYVVSALAEPIGRG